MTSIKRSTGVRSDANAGRVSNGSLSDTNPRIRAYALEVEARDRRLREEFRNMIEQDELDLEALAERFNEKLADPEREPARECIEGEIPF